MQVFEICVNILGFYLTGGSVNHRKALTSSGIGSKLCCRMITLVAGKSRLWLPEAERFH